MNTRTSLFALSVASLFAVGCGESEESQRARILAEEEAKKAEFVGGKKFYIVGEGEVGVVVEHDDISAFLYSGDAKSDKGDKRRTVYFITEGAVTTVMAAEQTSSIVPTRRTIKDMYDFEKEEFARAVEFYTARAGEALRPVTAPAANDSVPKLQ